MIAALIGLVSSLITILIFTFLKRVDKNTIYGLILLGIGFLYIGYTWSDIDTAILSLLQALFFMVLAYLGIKRSYWYLVAGYFLHGIWDMVYPIVANPELLPPDYDYFCLTYDFIVALYLWILNYRASQNQK
jgi:Family of unknown function (DUF6010)